MKLINIVPVFLFLYISRSYSDGATDEEYPGTSVTRMNAAVANVKALTPAELNGDYEAVRKAFLKAGGLYDLPSTSHCFTDFNHNDLTTMNHESQYNENDGSVKGISKGNNLGSAIAAGSDPSLGDGGSWCTCMIGSGENPPNDVAHTQFHSRIAFKLVWVPPSFESFVLVDDSGKLLNKGTPTGVLPDLDERKGNYNLVKGSKYAAAADKESTINHDKHHLTDHSHHRQQKLREESHHSE